MEKYFLVVFPMKIFFSSRENIIKMLDTIQKFYWW